MPKMRLLKDNWRYAKTPLKKGDVFDVKEIHADILPTMGIAELVDAKGKATAKAPKSKAAAAKTAAPRKSAANPAPQGRVNTQELTDMTVVELRAAAQTLGIKVQRGASKADILSKVRRRYQRRDMQAVD